MIVGVPKEVKDLEARVAVTPAGVSEYVANGHQVLIEQNAGAASGFLDDEYAAAGAEIVATPQDVYGRADMILKVKEPIPSEFDLLRSGQILFTYLHLAADEPLTRTLVDRKVNAIAYETVQVKSPGGPSLLPLLSPMSEVAGRMSIQVGARYLEKTAGGLGLLLGGVPGVAPANVVIVGGGMVGTNAAHVALGMGAAVTILDNNVNRLRYLDEILSGRITLLASNRYAMAEAVKDADLVIGSVLIPGKKAPKLVTRDMIESMRPGSVVVDVAIDQGGCFETSKPTTHSDPTYEVNGVIHYCVTNIPGAVPRTSTLALSNVTLPYGLAVANRGLRDAVSRDPALALGVNVYDGHITHPAIAESFGLEHTPVEQLLLA